MDVAAKESDSLWLSFKSSLFINASSEIHALVFSTLDELSFQHITSTCKLWNKIVVPFAINSEIQKIIKLFQDLIHVLNAENSDERKLIIRAEILIDCIAKGCLFQDNFQLFKKSVKALELPIRRNFHYKQLTKSFISNLTIPFLLNTAIQKLTLSVLDTEFISSPSEIELGKRICFSPFTGFCYVIYEFCQNNEFEYATKNLDKIPDVKLKDFMIKMIIKYMCLEGLFNEATKLLNKTSSTKRLEFCKFIQIEESKSLDEYERVYNPKSFIA